MIHAEVILIPLQPLSQALWSRCALLAVASAVNSPPMVAKELLKQPN